MQNNAMLSKDISLFHIKLAEIETEQKLDWRNEQRYMLIALRESILSNGETLEHLAFQDFYANI